MHINMMAEARQHGIDALTNPRGQVLRMDSQHTASITWRLFALYSIMIRGMAQHKALVMEDALHHGMCGTAETLPPIFCGTPIKSGHHRVVE